MILALCVIVMLIMAICLGPLFMSRTNTCEPPYSEEEIRRANGKFPTTVGTA
jgi:hypothetical protein